MQHVLRLDSTQVWRRGQLTDQRRQFRRCLGRAMQRLWHVQCRKGMQQLHKDRRQYKA